MNAVAAINVNPAGLNAAMPGLMPGSTRQAPGFANLMNALLGPQPGQAGLAGSRQPTQSRQPLNSGQPTDSEQVETPTEASEPQIVAAPVSAAQLAEAMMRSMFASSGNLASTSCSLTSGSSTSNSSTASSSLKKTPAPVAEGANPQSTQPAQTAPVVPPAVMAMAQSPLLRSADTAGKTAAFKLPSYATVIPAASKPASTAPLAFGMRITPVAASTPQTPEPAPQAAAQEQEPAVVAGETPAAAAEMETQPQSQSQLGPAQSSKPASPASPAAPASDPKARQDTLAHAEAAPIVTATAASGSAGDGANDFTRQMAGEVSNFAAAPLGKAQTTTAAASASAALRAAEPSAPAAAAQSGTPVKEIALRIATGQAPAVDVHFAERAGQLHVAVRTADGGLQTSLREDLGTLVNSLERSGYRAETFTPRAETAPVAASAETNLQNGRRDSESQPGSRGGNGDSPQDSHSGQQQQRRDPRQPKWIDELENQQ